MGRVLGALLLLAVLPVVPAVAAHAATHQRQAVELCVLVPRVEPVDEGEAFGEVPTAKPTLLVVEPLQQVRIESPSGQLLWSRRFAVDQPLTAPLPWPLPALRSSEEVVLRLQPVGALDDAFAHVHLRAAPAARMAATASLIAALGPAPEAWMAAINRALEASDVPLAWSLLYASQAPASQALDNLRRELLRRGCGDSERPDASGAGPH